MSARCVVVVCCFVCIHRVPAPVYGFVILYLEETETRDAILLRICARTHTHTHTPRVEQTQTGAGY